MCPLSMGRSTPIIVGFHMTSLKFKLQNYRSYWDFKLFYFHGVLEQLLPKTIDRPPEWSWKTLDIAVSLEK